MLVKHTNLRGQSSLSGKQHFVGSDQLHGYEERLTSDIYPAGRSFFFRRSGTVLCIYSSCYQ